MWKHWQRGVVCWLLMMVAAQAAEPGSDPRGVFAQFISKSGSAFSGLTSYRLRADLKITSMDDGMARREEHITLLAKGDRIKEIEERQGKDAASKETRIYYLTPNQLTFVQKGGDEVAAETLPLLDRFHNGLFNCPGFMENSFLTPDIGEGGMPALLVSALASPASWDGIQKDMTWAEADSTGTVIVHLKGQPGACAIRLVSAADSPSGHRVESISYYDMDGRLDRTVKVEACVQDPNLGPIGKQYSMTLYRDGNPKRASVIWNFTVREMQINCPVSDDDLIFKAPAGRATLVGNMEVYTQASE